MQTVFFFFSMLFGLSACEGDSKSHDTLRIFAASSMTDVFRELQQSFKADNAEVPVTFNFAGSQVLRLQLEHGAKADIFASADIDHVQALQKSGLAEKEHRFAGNTMALIVPKSNPESLMNFTGLPTIQRLVIGTKDVPAGKYTRMLLDKANANHGKDFKEKTLQNVVSEESNVRLIRAKVALGEADAAFVYKSDTLNTDGITEVEIPDGLNIKTDCYAAVMTQGNQELSKLWIQHLLSAKGQEVLRRNGFEVRQ